MNNIIKTNYKKINNMAIPILLNYILSTAFELIDKAIVGRYSLNGFAAVGIPANIIFAVTGSLGIMSVAYNIVAAKAKSEKDDKKFVELYYIVQTVSIAIGIIFVALSLVFGNVFFAKVYNLKPEIHKLAMEYFYVDSFTVLLNMIVFNYSVYFRNQENTKVTFYSTCVSTVVNIFFDYSLVYGKFGLPELGVKGAAYGSIIGLCAGILLYKIVSFKKYNLKIKLSFKLSYIKQIIKLYIPLVIQDLFESTLYVMLLMAIVTRLDVMDVAAYNLLSCIGSLVLLPTFAFAQSAMTLSLQETDYKKSISFVKCAIIESCTFVIVLSLIVYIFPKITFGFITKSDELINISKNIMPIIVIMQILNAVSQVLKSHLQGHDDEKFVLVISVGLSLLSLIWIYALSKCIGLKGIYIGMAINYIVCSAIYTYKQVQKN